MQMVALTLMLAVSGIAAAALIGAGRQRPEATAPATPGEPHRTSPTFRWLGAGVVGAALLLEMSGLWVSFRAYKEEAPPTVDVLVMAGAVLLFASVAYFVYLWTVHRFALRRRRLAGPPLE